MLTPQKKIEQNSTIMPDEDSKFDDIKVVTPNKEPEQPFSAEMNKEINMPTTSIVSGESKPKEVKVPESNNEQPESVFQSLEQDKSPSIKQENK